MALRNPVKRKGEVEQVATPFPNLEMVEEILELEASVEPAFTTLNCCLHDMCSRPRPFINN